MSQLKVIITGTTGMVGEGVLLECLSNHNVAEVLSISRRPAGLSHPKLKEYIVPDFLNLNKENDKIKGYDACFFCAGVSSIGMSEEDYTAVTYNTTLHFAKVLAAQSSQMTFIYVSGAGTDSTEEGSVMWARVKGRTENALMQLPFKKVYNFRPGFMRAVRGQQHTLTMYKYLSWMYPILKFIFPNIASELSQVGRAMVRCVIAPVDMSVMEVSDMNEIGKEKTSS